MAEDGDELPSVDHGRRTDEGRDKNAVVSICIIWWRAQGFLILNIILRFKNSNCIFHHPATKRTP